MSAGVIESFGDQFIYFRGTKSIGPFTLAVLIKNCAVHRHVVDRLVRETRRSEVGLRYRMR